MAVGDSHVYGMGSTLTAREKDLYLNIEKEIQKYPNPRIEIVKRIGGFSQPVNSHKLEWSIRDHRAIKATVAVAAASGATKVIVNEPGVFNKDDVFMKPDGQQCIVTSVTGGTEVTFIPWSGTAEAVDIGDTLTIVGVAAAQGADADSMVVKGFDDLFNYTQIVEDVVELSGTEHNALIRGKEGSGTLIANAQRLLTEKWQNTLIVGKRNKDDARQITSTGGLKFMIDTYASGNVINFGGSGTWSTDSAVLGKVDDMLDKLSAKVFDKPVLYVGAKFMRKFKYVMDDTIRTEQENDVRGIGVVGSYLSHLYGKVKVVLIQERAGLMDDLVFAVDESDIGEKAMRGREWQTYPLARTGDKFKWQILSERTFKMGMPERHAYLYNLGV